MRPNVSVAWLMLCLACGGSSPIDPTPKNDDRTEKLGGDNPGEDEDATDGTDPTEEADPSTLTYAISVSVSGLTGSGLTLTHGTTVRVVESDGTYTMAELPNGTLYEIEITQQPSGQSCASDSLAGVIVDADATLAITCVNVIPPTYSIGGVLTGLTGSIVLQNNGGDDLLLSSNGAFTFATSHLDGSTYDVTLASDSPYRQNCRVEHGTSEGTVAGANIDDILVTCTTVPDGAGDKTFGTSGFGEVVSDIDVASPESDKAYAVVVQASGKVVVAGTCQNMFTLVRYDTDGSIDETFGFNAGGIVKTNVGSAAIAYAAVLDASGRIVVAGVSYNTTTLNRDMTIVRYSAEGDLDTTFNGTGKAYVNFGGDDDYAYAVAIDSEDRIVVAGASCNAGAPCASNNRGDATVARLLDDGSPDSSFSGDGKARLNIGGEDDAARAVVVASDDGVLIAGSSGHFDPMVALDSSYDFLIARFDETGVLDDSYGGNGNGVRVTNFNDGSDLAYAAALDSEGRLVVAGTAYNGAVVGGSAYDMAVVRYTAAGQPDTTFSADGTNTHGRITIDMTLGDLPSEARALAIDTDDSIVLAGYAYTAPSYFAATRRLANGRPDPAFKSKIYDFLHNHDIAMANAVALDGADRWVMAGYEMDGNEASFMVHRGFR